MVDGKLPFDALETLFIGRVQPGGTGQFRECCAGSRDDEIKPSMTKLANRRTSARRNAALNAIRSQRVPILTPAVNRTTLQLPFPDTPASTRFRESEFYIKRNGSRSLRIHRKTEHGLKRIDVSHHRHNEDQTLCHRQERR